MNTNQIMKQIAALFLLMSFAGAATTATLPNGIQAQDTILRDASGNVVGSSSSPQVVSASGDTAITGQASMTTGNNTIATNGSTATTAANFHSGSVQIVGSAGIASGAVTFEQSNDGTNFSTMVVIEQSTTGQTLITAATTIAASTSRLFSFPITANFIRCRISTTISGGTIQAFANLSQMPFSNPALTATQATAANLNVTPAIPARTTSGVIGNTQWTGLSANPAVVTTGRNADGISDLIGVPIVQLGGIPSLQLPNRVALASATETTQIAAVASNRNIIYSIVIANLSAANSVQIDLRDTTGGTIRETFNLPIGQTIIYTPPAGLVQAAVNTNWTVQATGTTPNVIVMTRHYARPY